MERLKLNIQRFATSGSLTTPANTDGTTFTFAWSRQSYSIADNKSTIYWEVRINAAYTYQSNAVKLGATTIDGSQVHGGGTWSNISRGTTTLISGTKDIYHNPNGTKTFAVSISGWTWESTWTSANNSSNPFVLDTIPRYTTVSTWSVASKTETSITLNWKTADTCSQIRYGTSTSSYTTANVNSNSGTVTISGLTAGQTYTLYFMPKRKDSSLWGDGSDGTWKSLTNQATYRYPYCSSTSKNFTIGQSVTISIYNPLKRDVKIQMWSHTSQGFVSDLIDVNTGNKDSYTGFDDVATRLYQSIPNAKSSAYNIDVWTGNHKEVNTVGNYSVDETANKPVFNDFTYADINSTTTALTGDDQKVIQGYSNIQAIISVANKATAQHYATMDHYDLIIQGNATQSASYSDSEDVTIVVNNANSGSIKVNAVDSRNIPKEVPKTATLIPYTNIQRGNISVTRAGNVGEATTLAFNGTLWEGDFGAATNTITSVQYRYKSTASGSSWSAYTSLTPPTPSGNSYSFSGLIAGDEGNTGFSVDNSFNIEVVVTDRLSSITFTTTLGTGIPHVAFGNTGVAIEGPYDENSNNPLQVNGKGNMVLMANNNANTDTYIVSDCKWNNEKIAWGVGAGGNNRGTWDFKLSKWRFYSDDNKSYINDNVDITGSAKVTKSLQIPKNSGAGYGLTNSDGSSIIRDWNNTNVTVDATGGGLYLGYQNTTNLNFMNNKGTINSSGLLNVVGGLQVGGVNALLVNAFKFRKFEKSMTIAANGMTALDMGAINVPSGYSYLGTLPIQCGYSDQWVVSFSNYDNNHIVAMGHSKYGASLTHNVSCYVVYIKDTVKSQMIL